jgi:hypothetical protein
MQPLVEGVRRGIALVVAGRGEERVECPRISGAGGVQRPRDVPDPAVGRSAMLSKVRASKSCGPRW